MYSQIISEIRKELEADKLQLNTTLRFDVGEMLQFSITANFDHYSLTLYVSTAPNHKIYIQAHKSEIQYNLDRLMVRVDKVLNKRNSDLLLSDYAKSMNRLADRAINQIVRDRGAGELSREDFHTLEAYSRDGYKVCLDGEEITGYHCKTVINDDQAIMVYRVSRDDVQTDIENINPNRITVFKPVKNW